MNVSNVCFHLEAFVASWDVPLHFSLFMMLAVVASDMRGISSDGWCDRFKNLGHLHLQQVLSCLSLKKWLQLVPATMLAAVKSD